MGSCAYMGSLMSKGIAAPARMAASGAPRLRFVFNTSAPLITTRHPDAAGNKFGFEGGRVLKLGQDYHLFVSEMVGDPIFVKMKLAHWRSGDGVQWKRVSTLYESSGDYSGNDPRGALWAPMPIYDSAEQRWNLFYVAYHTAPNADGNLRTNYHGEIWRAKSEIRGMQGVGGPYKDNGVILSPGPDSDPWEGFQGTDSFFPYRVGDAWYGFYGSCTVPLPVGGGGTRKPPFWWVGLAKAPRLAGPWKRVSALNPVPIEKVFIENPVVAGLPEGGYLCVYDTQTPDAIGYAFSPDGIHWQPGKSLVIQSQPGVWCHDVRTPLGLVPDSGNEYLVYYTGFENTPDWNKLLEANGEGAVAAIGRARVRLEW